MDKKILQIAKQIAEENAVLLGVPAPRFVVKESKFFATPTSFFCTDGDNIYVNNAFKGDIGLLHLGVCHEMKHIYQIKHGLFSFGYHKKGLGLQDYNNQDAELDANAWSYAFNKVVYGMIFDFSKLNGEVRKKIMEIANCYETMLLNALKE